MAICSLRSGWLGIIAAGLLAVSLSPVGAEDNDADKAALSAALKNVPITLQQGIKSSEQSGKPISAKFELDDGKLQLSVYTAANGAFSEVVVAPGTGAIASTEKITDSEDLKAAESQAAAMEKSSASLATATEKALGQSAGARAVSVYPEIRNNQPVAVVTVLRGGQFETITEPLS